MGGKVGREVLAGDLLRFEQIAQIVERDLQWRHECRLGPLPRCLIGLRERSHVGGEAFCRLGAWAGGLGSETVERFDCRIDGFDVFRIRGRRGDGRGIKRGMERLLRRRDQRQLVLLPVRDER